MTNTETPLEKEIKCFVIPRSPVIQNLQTLELGTIRVQQPLIPPLSLSRMLDSMVESRAKLTSAFTTNAMIEIIGATVEGWISRKDPNREEAERHLPAITGFSPPMVRTGLDLILKELTQEKLGPALDRGLGDRRVLDGFLPLGPSKRILRRAVGPQLSAHILSGNIPGLGIGELVQAILLKSACLCKTSSKEPLCLALFAHSLIKTEPRLASCIAVLGWESGTVEAEQLEEVLFRRADLVTATGTDDSVSEIKRSWAASSPVRSRFIAYGHRFSLGFIGKESIGSKEKMGETARAAAWDIILYDQQGCLSPHLFYVEGAHHLPAEFAKTLGSALEEIGRELPRGRVEPGASSQIQQARSVAEMKKAAGETAELFGSPGGTDWTVILEADPDIVLSPLYRTIRIKPIAKLEDVAKHLGPWKAHLQAAGIAVAESRRLSLAELLGRAGFNRICPVGKMQNPPADWPQDGHRFVADRVRWIDFEKP